MKSLDVSKALETLMGNRSHCNIHFKPVLSLMSKIYHAQARNLCILFLQPPETSSEFSPSFLSK